MRDFAVVKSGVPSVMFSRSMYHGSFISSRDVRRDDLVGDRQRRVLRVVMDVAIARGPQLVVLLDQQPREELRRQQCRRP